MGRGCIHLNNYLLNKYLSYLNYYLFSTYYVPNTVLSVWDTAVNKTGIISTLWERHKTDHKQNKSVDFMACLMVTDTIFKNQSVKRGRGLCVTEWAVG